MTASERYSRQPRRRTRTPSSSTPTNRLVCYVGAVDGQSDLAEYVFDDLPNRVQESVYEWSNEFDVEPVEHLGRESPTYGLVVIERSGAALETVHAEQVDVIETMESDVMGKTKAGGQSAQRFERDRERQKREFFEVS